MFARAKTKNDVSTQILRATDAGMQGCRVREYLHTCVLRACSLSAGFLE